MHSWFLVLNSETSDVILGHGLCGMCFADSESDKKSAVDQAFRDELLHSVVSYFSSGSVCSTLCISHILCYDYCGQCTSVIMVEC